MHTTLVLVTIQFVNTVGGMDSSHDTTHPGLIGTGNHNGDKQASAIKVSDQVK